MDPTDQEFIKRIYNCPKCKLMHTIKFPRDIAKNKPIFPFPYVFLHSSEEGLDDLLTVLYIDLELHIRAVEVMEVDDSNIFSEELTKQITEKLMNRIISLEEENLQLKDLITKIDLEKVSGMEERNPKIMSIPKIEYPSEIRNKPVSLEPQLPKLKDIKMKQPTTSFKDIKAKQPSINISDLQEIPKPEIKTKEPIQEISVSNEFINVFITSTVGPGEKKQDLNINLEYKVGDLKDTIGNIFGLMPSNFHISSGGITFEESLSLKDYRLEDGDEILIIPSSTAGLNFKKK